MSDDKPGTKPAATEPNTIMRRIERVIEKHPDRSVSVAWWATFLYGIFIGAMLFGCSPAAPDPRSIPGFSMSTADAEPYNRRDIGLSMFVLSQEWEAEFGETLPPFAVDILYTFTGRIGRGVTGMSFEDATIVIVIDRQDGSTRELWDTALTHELVHSIFQLQYGDGDGDHAEGDGPWTLEHSRLINRCDERLRLLLERDGT